MSAIGERVARAGQSGGRLARAPAESRTRALEALAASLADPAVRARVLEANRRDLAAASGLAPPLLRRLALDATKLETLADGARQLAARADPLGAVLARRKLDEGLLLTQERCPLGVLAVVFESRPDALVQIASLALRSGNAVLLKGGREAAESNRALADVVRGALGSSGLPADAVQLLDDRSEVDALLGLEKGVDLVVARGGKDFVEHVRARSRVPVLAHAEGVCHVFLHRSADPSKAARIVVDSKVTYPAACNAAETLLWEPGAEAALDATVAALRSAGVELRGDAATRARHPDMKVATGADWDAEYGALILAVARVDDLDAAMAHIARHGSQHTEAIVAEDRSAADRFLAEVDAACVFHDASTRFADGYRFGLGGEVGIGTGKLHARGPVGVDGLLTFRWLLRGSGQVSAEYGPGKKPFLHEEL
ncbi:MAG TPA: glutamate-5-semialdehyde dehydrogenase [Myxococcaceae bacterium]|nr:glutamate-5-semialdehyde dehydrogenase [Myxococcaceae bacterium]